MSLSVDGVWKVGVWATTVWADGVWREGAAPEPEVTLERTGGGGGSFHFYENKRKWRRLDEGIKDELRRLWRQLDQAPAEIRQEAAQLVKVAEKRAKDEPVTLPETVPFPKFPHVDWSAVLQVLSVAVLREMVLRAEDEEEDEFLLLS